MNIVSASESVLVTGGSGFVGSWIVRKLVEKGLRVRAHVLDRHNVINITDVLKEVEVVSGDLTDFACARESASGCTAVVHAAAIKKNAVYHSQHPAEILYANTLITQNVLEASRLAGVRSFLSISSTVVNDWSDAHYGYAWSKRFDEIIGKAYARQYDFQWAALRLPSVFGPGDNFDSDTAQVVPSLIRRIVSGENPLCVVADTEPKPFSYIEDAANAVAGLVLEAPGYSVFQLNPSFLISIGDVAKVLARIFNEKKEASIIVKNKNSPSARHKIPGVGTFLEAGIKRTQEPLCELSEALERTVDWYLAHRA